MYIHKNAIITQPQFTIYLFVKQIKRKLHPVPESIIIINITQSKQKDHQIIGTILTI